MKCDALSFCSEGSKYQLNLMSTVIAVILTVIVFTISCQLTRRQKSRNSASQKKDPSASSEAQTAGSLTNMPGQHQSLVRVSFQDLHFQVPNTDTTDPKNTTRDILPCISGDLPEGKFNVVMGPTAW